MVERDRAVEIALISSLEAKTISAQSLERWRSHVPRRRIILLHGGQRFSQLPAEFGSSVPKSIQYLLLSAGRGLLASEDVATAAVHGFQPQHVLRAEAGDGAFDGSRAACALADLAPQLLSQRRIFLPAHQRQRFRDALVGNQA